MVKRTELDLKNGDFSAGFRNVDEVGELTVAEGWHPWWQQGGKPEGVSDGEQTGYFFRPEYKPEDASKFGRKRIRTGDFAQKWFTTYSTHNAGLYQQVTGVPLGKKITLSAWVQVWSSQQDNIDQSMENGRYKTAVGIDPYGGTDPLSPQVLWSELIEEYDEWGQRTVTVESVSDTITVYLRGTAQWRVKHNDSYWDEVRLVSEPLLKPADYLLLPDGADAKWYRAAAPFLARFGLSAGSSLNDAGLLEGTVIAVAPDPARQAKLEELDMAIEVLEAQTPEAMASALEVRMREGHHLQIKPPSERDYILLPVTAGSEWYTALLPYLMHFGPSSGRNVETALQHTGGFVTAINPNSQVLERLQADEDIRLDLIQAASPEVLRTLLQKRIDSGRRVK